MKTILHIAALVLAGTQATAALAQESEQAQDPTQPQTSQLEPCEDRGKRNWLERPDTENFERLMDRSSRSNWLTSYLLRGKLMGIQRDFRGLVSDVYLGPTGGWHIEVNEMPGGPLGDLHFEIDGQNYVLAHRGGVPERNCVTTSGGGMQTTNCWYQSAAIYEVPQQVVAALLARPDDAPVITRMMSDGRSTRRCAIPLLPREFKLLQSGFAQFQVLHARYVEQRQRDAERRAAREAERRRHTAGRPSAARAARARAEARAAQAQEAQTPPASEPSTAPDNTPPSSR